ncbi:Oxidoreductase family, NAD-binding Rossmann fold [Lentzea xinjiangensis]|uniref:Oxidoreductase family, NAD-binding Rossmann fold n=1 Tax=Lentzea xinjiangensis TaxID=402600 RepID=A0A1H9G8P0_9PSEU|nr:Gfo/Idh/MocA family oxidoreductase [Lentzea xinjiangensis]SEQ46487.1 Oxidoreductase family, NAD-binding Rossmann fold [Lentzea xinjiangensis]
MARRRYAVVGTGSRAERHVRAIAVEHAETCELVAFADVNRTRMDVHNERLAGLGVEPVPAYDAAGFRRMLDEQRVDVVVVTTVDRFHDTYIVGALDAGRDVVTEKPMTTDVPSAVKILDAVQRNDGNVTVTFNYRYNPIHEKVRALLADGAVGEIGSVHFEWLLDTRHGADYFRRWHRDKANSGGLMVHKATHHFDLLNWWVGSVPETVYAHGRLFFYGEENGKRHGYSHDERFTIDLERDAWLKKLYLDARHEDGYRRDQNPFAPGVSIEDDMSVLVRYASGANLTYHLTAYSPWEGYRLMVNGSRGRLELEVVENSWVSGQHPAVHGVSANPEQGWATLSVQRLFERREEIPLEHGGDGHGGADQRMVDALYGPAGQQDPLGRRATHRDGVLSLLTGFAANRSFETGGPVRVADLIDLR